MTVKLYTPPTLPARGYSQVCEITSGKLVMFAGQVPHDVNDRMVGEGSFEAQVEQVFRNLDLGLKAAGGSHNRTEARLSAASSERGISVNCSIGAL